MSYLERLKRQLPLDVVKDLELSINPNLKWILPKEGDNILLRLEEKVEYSDYYFEVRKYYVNNGRRGFQCRVKPASSSIPTDAGIFVSTSELGSKIQSWSELISQFHDTNTPFDDPSLKAQYDWYASSVKFVDEEGDRPFVGEPLQLLVEHSNKLISFVEGLDYDEEEKQEFVEEVKGFKQSLTKTPRRDTFDLLLRLWAKGTKSFPEVVSFVKREFMSWSAGRIFDGTLELISGVLTSG